MSTITLLIISISLAMDCFAISFASGLIVKKIRLIHAVRIAFFFGLFQAGMPIIGWTLGTGLKNYIQDFDHWIAFILLSYIGLKMVYESIKEDADDVQFNPLLWKTLLTLSVATSIDALIIGFSFAVLDVNLFYAVSLIGIITFILSMIGLYLGIKFGNKIKLPMETIGGIVLYVIGAKILIEHLYFS